MVSPDIMYEKEFYQLRHIDPEIKKIQQGYINYNDLKMPMLETLQLQGHQLFIRNLFNPQTNYKRLLLYHGTGTGKSMVINSLAKTYIDFFKKMKQQPQITIIGFTEKIIIKDLLKFPELGYIKQEELDELERLSSSTNEKDIARRKNLKAALSRKIVNKSRGGYYKFYGYQAFAQDLIQITTKGTENKITYNYIYEDEDKLQSRIDELTQKDFIILNTQLINSLKNGFIACDESHLLYNVTGKNNRGMAIKYVLEKLENEDPKSAPRVLYSTATPLTGSPMEIIDVMELLVPKSSYKRSDFFTDNTQFKPGALDKIAQICKGYISFLKDSDTTVYPERLLIGESIPGLPYLKFMPCRISSYQEKTLREYKKHDPKFETLLSSETITLYDMAFPNPESDSIGLYNSKEIVKGIKDASDKWKRETGIYIDEYGVINGSFLQLDNIGKYSCKYKNLLKELIHNLDQEIPGKMFVYHYYVSTSGLLLIQNMLLQNGFIGVDTTPLSTTRCAICGVPLKDHKRIDDHVYKPARFLTVYGEMSPAEIDNTISLYNSKENKDGYEYRILLGSRVINEGYDFKEIRFMYIASLPKDISTMLQVFGRAVRRNSHVRLTPENRYVKIHIMVGTLKDELSPEVLNYKRKLQVFLQIQQVEKEMRIYAIDNFINYHKMNLSDKPTLEGLPYKPAIVFNPQKVKIPDYLDTYYRYGYIQAEIKEITIILKKIFGYCPVWKYEDLIKEIRNPDTMLDTQYDHKTFDEKNIIIALDFLLQQSNVKMNTIIDMGSNTELPYITLGNEVRVVVYRDPFYILSPVDENGIPILDYDQWMQSNLIEINKVISLNSYVKNVANKEKFQDTISTIVDKYSHNIYLTLVEIPVDYHLFIIKQIIEQCSGGVCNTSAVEVDYKVCCIMEPMYNHMNILLYEKDFINREVSKTYGITNTKKPIGYRLVNFAYLFFNNKYIEVPISIFNTLNRQENNKLIGFIKRKGKKNEFLIRYPLSKLTIHKDRRKINKGAVCNTYSSNQRQSFIEMLDIKKKKYTDICESIKIDLLNREVKSRNDPNGLRWFYIPFDFMPYL